MAKRPSSLLTAFDNEDYATIQRAVAVTDALLVEGNLTREESLGTLRFSLPTTDAAFDPLLRDPRLAYEFCQEYRAAGWARVLFKRHLRSVGPSLSMVDYTLELYAAQE